MPKKFLQFIFINGKGGSGKDTQADLILEKHREKADRISTGEIYRGARDNKEGFARYHDLIAPYIFAVDKKGEYIPDEIIVPIVEEVILERITGGKEIFIFTGFPRTDPQLSMVDSMLDSLGNKYDVSSHHIYYSLSDETTRKRTGFRRELAIKNGEHVRPDDEPEAIEKRLEVFRRLAEPMLDRLAKEGRLIVIDAEGTIPAIETETSTRLSKERV